MAGRPFARRCAATALILGLGAVSALAPTVAGARPARSHKTYSNATYHYVVDYPGNWALSHSKAVQFIAVAPDHKAFLTANAIPGTLALADIKTAQKAAFTRLGKIRLGKMQSTIDYALKSIHKVTFQTAEALVKLPSGGQMDVILLDTDQHATLYDFDAGVVTGAAAANRERTALDNALNSITLGAQ